MSAALPDEDWDSFLKAVPQASHLQSESWSKVKLAGGWRRERVSVQQAGQAAAAAQVLIRRVRGFGLIGQVPFGPVVAPCIDPQAAALAVVQKLEDLMQRERLAALIVQPPRALPEGVDLLLGHGFLPMPTAITPQLPATVIVDVRPEEAALLAAMHEKTRYNVRLAQRRGVKIRHGGKADLPILHDLLKATGVRQDFEATPITSLESTWDSFGSDAALLLAEVEGEAVSAGLFLGFGDTVSCKRAAWSGEQGRLHPNELLHWAAMLWAKETGRHHYDFEGLHADVAKAALEPASPERPARGVATFKLGFGGTIELGSPAYGIFRHGALKFAYRLMPQSLLEGKFTRRLAARTRR